jgi:RNA polymerase sigma factor (sigma-70 family)
MVHATDLFNKLAESGTAVQVQGARLPIPRQILQNVKSLKDLDTTHGKINTDLTATQNASLNQRTEPEEDVPRLDVLYQAVAAYQATLTLSTKEHAPHEWALIQNNLGNMLHDIALLLEGDERTNALHRAISCFDEALSIFRPEENSSEWAVVQKSKGDVLRDLAEALAYASKEDILQEAIYCYIAALTIYSKDIFPFEWAKLKYDLSLVYRTLANGNRLGYLEQSISCMREALQIFMLDAFPVEYAMAQGNLGSAYSQRSKGEKQSDLERALESYQEALRVLTEHTFPLQWATIQINLGKIYQIRSWGDQLVNLKEAVRCYRSALKIYRHDNFEEQHTNINASIESVHQILDEHKSFEDLLYVDVDHYFKQFYNDFARRIRGYITKKIGQDIEDIIQETFIDAYFYFKRPSAERIKSILPWLYRVASNQSGNYLRKNSQINELSLESLFYGDIDYEEDLDNEDFLDEAEIDNDTDDEDFLDETEIDDHSDEDFSDEAEINNDTDDEDFFEPSYFDDEDLGWNFDLTSDSQMQPEDIYIMQEALRDIVAKVHDYTYTTHDPSRNQIIIQMALFEDRSYRDVAQQLNISSAVVGHVVREARRFVREAMGHSFTNEE